MRTHLMRDRPKPEMAPYLPAADVVKQNDKKKPIQLKRNATGDRKIIISHHQSNMYKEKEDIWLPTSSGQVALKMAVHKCALGKRWNIKGDSYWRKWAWRCRHFLFAADQHLQSHPWLQSRPPAPAKSVFTFHLLGFTFNMCCFCRCNVVRSDDLSDQEYLWMMLKKKMDIPWLSQWPAGWQPLLCSSQPRHMRAEWWQRCKMEGWETFLHLLCIQRKLWKSQANED